MLALSDSCSGMMIGEGSSFRRRGKERDMESDFCLSPLTG